MTIDNVSATTADNTPYSARKSVLIISLAIWLYIKATITASNKLINSASVKIKNNMRFGYKRICIRCEPSTRVFQVPIGQKRVINELYV